MTKESNDPNNPSHFNGKDALQHVVEVQAEGIVSSSEIHGTEMPGHMSAGCDAARETAVVLPIVLLLLTFIKDSPDANMPLLFIFTCGWVLWKVGRSAWLGWFRLERLHRVLEQERYEIEHHYEQERDELRVLYAAKGFEGKLLEDVLDVLMADNERLLKVMVEEELGLSLETTEHPLKQGLGAFVGGLAAALLCLSGLFAWPIYGIFVGAAIAIAMASAFTAYMAENEEIPAIIWNLGIAVLAIGTVYFLLEWHQLSVK